MATDKVNNPAPRNDLATFDALARRCAEALTAIGEAFNAMLPNILAVGEQVHAVCWQMYEEAGKPYGDNDEGMLRWMREDAEKRDAAERAEQER